MNYVVMLIAVLPLACVILETVLWYRGKRRRKWIREIVGELAEASDFYQGKRFDREQESRLASDSYIDH